MFQFGLFRFETRIFFLINVRSKHLNDKQGLKWIETIIGKLKKITTNNFQIASSNSDFI